MTSVLLTRYLCPSRKFARTVAANRACLLSTPTSIMPKNNRKRKRGEAEVLPLPLPSSGVNVAKTASDLGVMHPSSRVNIPSSLMLDNVLNRLDTTGYKQVAIAHIVYGKPQVNADAVQNETVCNKYPRLRILKRLYAVVENLSDVAYYVAKTRAALAASSDSDIGGEDALNKFDVVSLSPRNDEAFQAACERATAAEIITLDYSGGKSSAGGRGSGIHLPFRIRVSDVKAVIARGAVFEIPYAPAVLNRNQRKGLVRTCRELQVASQGLKPKIVFSSGSRMVDETDVGAMALRMPDDLRNVIQTVLGFTPDVADAAINTNALYVIERGRKRRYGNTVVANVYIDDGTGNRAERSRNHDNAQIPNKMKSELADAKHNDGNDSAGDKHVVEDGFIAF